MRGYGLPRLPCLESPDIADIREFGLSSHVGSIKGKSGVYKSNCKSKNKKASRRIWKKKARRDAKKECVI